LLAPIKLSVIKDLSTVWQQQEIACSDHYSALS